MNKKLARTIFWLVLLIGDISIIYISFILAFKARFFWPWLTNLFPVSKGMPLWTPYGQLFSLAVFLYIAVFISNKFYIQRILSVYDELILVIQGVFIGTLLMMLVTFIYRGYEYSRLVVGLGAGILVILIYSWHILIKFGYRWLFRLLIGQQNVLVIGNPEQIEYARSVLKKQGFLRTYFVLEQKNEDELFELINRREISEVFISPTYFGSSRLLLFSDRCEEMGVDFKVIPSVLQLCQGQIVIDNSLLIPVFHIKPVSLHGLNYYYKRVFDIFFASMLLSVLFVPLVIIAFLIKVDSSGPVFYYHKRMGHRKRAFNFYKFRTMVQDADARLESLKHLTERAGPVFKMKNDPRITKLGKFLRRFSIDELPQLINVLKGEMSLVGPRPQVLWEAEAYDDIARRRLRVLPGITGLWQVSGRATLSYTEMIELDIYYIENWTIGLDLKIILKTIPAIFSKVGAY